MLMFCLIFISDFGKPYTHLLSLSPSNMISTLCRSAVYTGAVLSRRVCPPDCHSCLLYRNKYYKLQFIPGANGDGSKTAKVIKEVLLPSITSPGCQRDAESPITLWINCSF